MGDRYDIREIAWGIVTGMAQQWSVGVAGEKPVATPVYLREARRIADELNRLHARMEAAEAALAEAQAKLAALHHASTAYREEVRGWEHRAEDGCSYDDAACALDRVLLATEDGGE